MRDASMRDSADELNANGRDRLDRRRGRQLPESSRGTGGTGRRDSQGRCAGSARRGGTELDAGVSGAPPGGRPEPMTGVDRAESRVVARVDKMSLCVTI